MTAEKLLDVAPVIPVVVLDDAGRAVPVARALAEGGIGIIEVTLRTPAAMESIRRIAAEVPGIVVGAGTVTSAAQAADATRAGARFLVTPGTTPALLAACEDTGLPLLPGAATVSEAMVLAERGHTALKFFPAVASGGVGFLQSVAGPLPGLRFCPTGGVTPASAPDYLALSTVSCVGGSWLTPKDAPAARITELAREAAKLAG